jgi:hypothetical protein
MKDTPPQSLLSESGEFNPKMIPHFTKGRLGEIFVHDQIGKHYNILIYKKTLSGTKIPITFCEFSMKSGPMGCRGLGQLAYDKGMRILTASQADNMALEHDDLEHGFFFDLFADLRWTPSRESRLETQRLTNHVRRMVAIWGKASPRTLCGGTQRPFENLQPWQGDSH